MTIDKIKTQITAIPKTSGIYQFFDGKEQILYIGKAKNLQKRLQNYTKTNQLSPRIARMVFLAEKLEYIQTSSELDALLLEHNLIKKFAPKFNILLRDDKTFPYIEISNHAFPRISKNRDFGKFKNDEVREGKTRPKSRCDELDERICENRSGMYLNIPEQWKHANPDADSHRSRDFGRVFGPFASGYDVNHSIDVLRKIFLLRNCSDAEFKSRQKPCLEYQIKKCSAPCVGMVSEVEYKNSIENAVDFLSGKSAALQKNLTEKMRQLSEAQNYEKAAFIRDQIKSLNAIQAKQNINIDELKNSDVITIITRNGMACIYISFYRLGQNYGAKPYFYELEKEKNISEFLSEFLGQFYLTQTPPNLVLLNVAIDQKNLMEDFLNKISVALRVDKKNPVALRVDGQKTKIKIPKKGDKLTLIKDQEIIALQNLEQKISQNLNNRELLFEVKKIFNLPKIIKKIEVYDNSHTSTTNAVGVLISAGVEGFIKSGYRKFNLGIKSPELIKNHDDTAMLSEVLRRRFSKLEKAEYPDLIIIDGGKPQLNAAKKIFDALAVNIPFIAMAKGENRNAGEEKFYRINEKGNVARCAENLSKNHPTMYYLQRLRDEAHRFAITTHRKKRNKAMIKK